MTPAQRLERLQRLREQRATLDGAGLQLLDSLEQAQKMWVYKFPDRLARARAKVARLEAEGKAAGLARLIERDRP